MSSSFRTSFPNSGLPKFPSCFVKKTPNPPSFPLSLRLSLSRIPGDTRLQVSAPPPHTPLLPQLSLRSPLSWASALPSCCLQCLGGGGGGGGSKGRVVSPPPPAKNNKTTVNSDTIKFHPPPQICPPPEIPPDSGRPEGWSGGPRKRGPRKRGSRATSRPPLPSVSGFRGQVRCLWAARALRSPRPRPGSRGLPRPVWAGSRDWFCFCFCPRTAGSSAGDRRPGGPESAHPQEPRPRSQTM